MHLGDMPQRSFSFGQFRRDDGETFTIAAILFETPIEYDYWRALYDAVHPEWGHMGFTLTIPKGAVPDFEHATLVVGGPALDQVKSEMAKASPDGRDFTWCPSPDGWTLIG